jgi:hypothetical protein
MDTVKDINGEPVIGSDAGVPGEILLPLIAQI